MLNNIIVFGPQGCGKTRNAEALCRHYVMSRSIDAMDFDREMRSGRTTQISGNLILLNDLDPHEWDWSARMVSFAQAMKEAGLSC